MLDAKQLEVLSAYAAGRLGTRQTIERAGLEDYADLIVAMSACGLDFPKPADTPGRIAQVAAASGILQPLLQHGV